MPAYDVVIRHLYVSPGHNYFGRAAGDAPGDHPTLAPAEVVCRAGRGIEGDRFFDRRPGYDGQVTFFAWEVVLALGAALPGVARDPSVFRRNVIVEGADLGALLGHAFTLGGVRFEGAKHCAPCRWMDHAYAPGALALLRGRGGLRARVLSDGALRVGATTLAADVAMDPANAARPEAWPALP